MARGQEVAKLTSWRVGEIRMIMNWAVVTHMQALYTGVCLDYLFYC
jgi:hypothetical protein